MAHHVSHLFTRDPLVIFDGMVELDDQKTTDHFENIQSTNWQTCRYVHVRAVATDILDRHADNPHLSVNDMTEINFLSLQMETDVVTYLSCFKSIQFFC